MLIPLWINNTIALLGGCAGRTWGLAGEAGICSWWLYLSPDLPVLPPFLLPGHRNVNSSARPTMMNGRLRNHELNRLSHRGLFSRVCPSCKPNYKLAANGDRMVYTSRILSGEASTRLFTTHQGISPCVKAAAPARSLHPSTTAMM